MAKPNELQVTMKDQDFVLYEGVSDMDTDESSPTTSLTSSSISSYAHGEQSAATHTQTHTQVGYTLTAHTKVLPSDGTRLHHSPISSRWDRQVLFTITHLTPVPTPSPSSPPEVDPVPIVLDSLSLACQVTSAARDWTKRNFTTSRTEETHWWEDMVRRLTLGVMERLDLGDSGWRYVSEYEEYDNHMSRDAEDTTSLSPTSTSTSHHHQEVPKSLRTFHSSLSTFSRQGVMDQLTNQETWHGLRTRYIDLAKAEGQDASVGERAWERHLWDSGSFAGLTAMEAVRDEMLDLIQDLAV